MKSLVAIAALCLAGCAGVPPAADKVAAPVTLLKKSLPKAGHFYAGADLSYLNEMQDCGARYQLNGTAMDPYELFAEAGSNLVRVRLWHAPDWTRYSNLEDVTLTIRRAKAAGMAVLLDLHYSDTWADPEKQFIPAAWQSLVDDTPALGQAVYQYTREVLATLAAQDLLPAMIQIGNETNSEILQLESAMSHEINWPRNVALLNQGLQAVADFNREQSAEVKSLLHIAQPENALWWFKEAREAGIADFDIIGLSYYPIWSRYGLDAIGEAIALLKSRYEKEVMIVETAYPWTLKNFDKANNILDTNALVPGYKATPQGQYDYLMRLSAEVIQAGGMGVIYWEPAWVSTRCSTLWGQGSHWENASFFDPQKNNEALKAMDFFRDALHIFHQTP